MIERSVHDSDDTSENAETTSIASLRRRGLDAGQRLVEASRGLRLSLDGVSLDDAARGAGVSRSSMYRVWPNKDAFEADLLVDLAGPGWQGYSAFDQQTVLEARTVLAEHLDMLATPEGRRAVMREAVRRAALQNFSAISTSVRWLTYVVLTAAAPGLPMESSGRIKASLRHAERIFNERMSDFYGDMALVLGYRLRNGVSSYAAVAAAGAAVIEGLALRAVMSPDLPAILVHVENKPFESEWQLPSASFLSVVESFIEPDDTYDPKVALVQYLTSLARQEAEAPLSFDES